MEKSRQVIEDMRVTDRYNSRVDFDVNAHLSDLEKFLAHAPSEYLVSLRKTIDKYAVMLAKESESLVAKFMAEKHLPASRVKLCYCMRHDIPGAMDIWVEEIKAIPSQDE